MTHREEVELLHEIAKKVAACLPDWEFAPPKPDDWMSYLKSRVDCGQQIGFRWDKCQTKRIEISGSFPNGLHQHLPYGRPKLSITVTADKPAVKIARDIVHRLLPDYREVFAAAVIRQDTHNASEKNKANMMSNLAAALGADLRDGNIYHYEPYCIVKAESDTRVEMELSVDETTALEIAKIIKA